MNATKLRIAEAFERHVSAQGYDHTNLDDVAAELKISKKTIYVHFDSKRDIYAYLVSQQAVREKMKLAAWVAPLPTYAEKLEAAMRSILESARAHIDATGRDEWMREYDIAADAFRKANGDLIRELVQSGMDAGEFRAGDALLVEKMTAAIIVEYLILVNADPSYDRDRELLERIVRFIG
ncbi:MAG: TetR/AcrR family transcriptional regulator [Coriobacteriia bacterium]